MIDTFSYQQMLICTKLRIGAATFQKYYLNNKSTSFVRYNHKTSKTQTIFTNMLYERCLTGSKIILWPLTLSFSMQPFSTPRKGVEKGCIGNKWVKIIAYKSSCQELSHCRTSHRIYHTNHNYKIVATQLAVIITGRHLNF